MHFVNITLHFPKLQGETGWAQGIVIMLSADDEAKLKDQFVSTHARSGGHPSVA
jgi:hypothetical protein